ncbi:MAG: hypothetical protein ACI9H8_000422 [Lysobacterales bacterium]|jgi:hypothetical protein
MKTALPLQKFAAQCLPALADQITELASHLDAGSYQLLKLIYEFDQHGGWQGVGIHSCAHWLNWKCGMNLGAAREKVRVANALPVLPKISGAMKDGRVSYSKVRAMTRVATAKNEVALLEVALGGTASHVEQQVRLYRKTKRIEALAEENLCHSQRELSWFQDTDGSWVFKGRLSREQGALMVKAMQAAMDQLFEETEKVSEDVSAETSSDTSHAIPEPIATRRADALERVFEGFLANAKHEHSGGDRYLINIHTDIDTLKADGAGAEAEIEGPGQSCVHVSAETSRRMACDCSVVHWHNNNRGNLLNIGRKSRSIPPAIRRALQRRDGGCHFPGCSCTRFVDAHHIKHWADGGETSMDNLVLLCRTHHRLVHEGGFGVKANPGGTIKFTLPSGKVIPRGPDTRFRGNLKAIKSVNRNNGLNITPKTPVPAWYGEQMDKNMAVEALLKLE